MATSEPVRRQKTPAPSKPSGDVSGSSPRRKTWRLMNAGQPCGEERTLGSLPFRTLRRCAPPLDSLSEEQHAPRLVKSAREEEPIKVKVLGRT
jgi:hypothetical protein